MIVSQMVWPNLSAHLTINFRGASHHTCLPHKTPPLLLDDRLLPQHYCCFALLTVNLLPLVFSQQTEAEPRISIPMGMDSQHLRATLSPQKQLGKKKMDLGGKFTTWLAG